MPPDLTIGSHPSPVQEASRASGVFARSGSAPAARNAAAAAGIAPAPENRVVLDPASDRVVLQYFDATGALINSLPSQRQLDAYRLAASAVASPELAVKKA